MVETKLKLVVNGFVTPTKVTSKGREIYSHTQSFVGGTD